MSLSNAEAMREIMQRATDGTPAGVAAAAALMADDARIWQQGTGWVGKAEKIAMWARSEGQDLKTVIRTLVAAGDEVAVEATVTSPAGAVVVAMFGRFKDGKLFEGREYFPPASASAIFQD